MVIQKLCQERPEVFLFNDTERQIVAFSVQEF